MPATRTELERIAHSWIEEGWQRGNAGVVDTLHATDFVDHDPGGRAADNDGFKLGIEIIRIRDGRITERWGEWDGIDLLEQLGRVRL